MCLSPARRIGYSYYPYLSVSCELNAYCDDAGKMMQLYSALHENIQDVFNEHGVQIMTPHYISGAVNPKRGLSEQWPAPPPHEGTKDP